MMAIMRIRTAAAAAVLTMVLAAAGCAVPGQSALPGTAAQTADGSISNAEVAEAVQAWVDATDGAVSPTRGEVVTSMILRDSVLEILDREGLVLSQQQYAALTEQWLSLYGTEEAPSEALLETAQTTMAITLLAETDPELGLLEEAAQAASDGVVSSPRLGEFSVDNVVSSATEAQSLASTTFAQFPPAAYLYVDGFDA